jgi:hypothetical protein
MERSKTTNRFERLAVVAAFGLCLGALWAQSVRAVEPTSGATPGLSQPKRSFTAASIPALPGLQCNLHPPGSELSAGVPVFTNDDGYARFYAVKMTASDAVNRLTLDCTDTTGKPSSYSVDLTSDNTFAPNPVNIANERGTDRPALSRDPFSYTQSELLQAGYGLRPDPVKNASAYALWLAAASRPARLLQTAHSDTISHTVIPRVSPPGPQGILDVQQATNWYGAVMTGSPPYTFTVATFNIPQAVPGGDQTTNTKVYIWNGLGGGTGSGLIQFFVIMNTTPTAASYWTKREYCCGDNQFSANAGYFAPNPGDVVLDEAWYCDGNGNENINGGYGCAFFQDVTSGAVLSCTLASGSPCSSVQAFPLCAVSPTTPNCMTLGQSAEFIIENGGGLTDFYPTVNMYGWATSARGDLGVHDDTAVTLLTDASANSHSEPYMAVDLTSSGLEGTCFAVSAAFLGFVPACPAQITNPPPIVGGGGGGVYGPGWPGNPHRICGHGILCAQ